MGVAAPGGAQPFEEMLDFEELEPKCVASVTRGDWGTGPVRVRGTSHRFGETNVAVVVDTEHPEADPDLTTGGYHNALIISKLPPRRPAGAAESWVPGFVQHIDDDDTPGGVLSFDFEETGAVTFYGLTLLDHDDHTATIRIFRSAGAGELFDSLDPGTHLELGYGPKSWWRNWLSPQRRRARLSTPDDEHPFHRLQIAPIAVSGKPSRVDLRELRARGRPTRTAVPDLRQRLRDGIPEVTRIEVRLGGSSAVDKVLFRRGPRAAPSRDEDLFARVQSRLTEKVKPELESLRASFYAEWTELTANPTPTVRDDLDALLVGLKRDLLGSRRRDGTRSGGLLQCWELPCGCPELRALQAWVEIEIEDMRADLADATERDLATLTGTPDELQIAALEPALYLAAARPSGPALASTGGRCQQGTFGDRFECKLASIWNGTVDTVASLWPPKVEFGASVTVAGVAHACEGYRLTPMSPDFDHVETGILPGESRRIPRGLYCVLCRTPTGLQPRAKLDLVADRNARPEPLAGAECASGR